MTTLNIEQIQMDTDVLVIGGGMAGCFAAIKAAEEGAKTIIFEKSNIDRSGNGGTGLHRIPLIHPDYNFDYGEFARVNADAAAGIADEDVGYAFAQDTLDRILDLEDYGIQVREERDGAFELWPAYDICPGKSVIWPTRLSQWHNVKPILANKAKSFDSITVINRIACIGLLTEDGRPGTRAIGAVGIETRTGRFIVCTAKAVVLASGGSYRLGRHKNSAYAPTRFIECGCPVNCGEGQAMAFRAGADLVNMEFVKLSGVWKDFNHWGPGPIYFTTKFIGYKGEELPSLKYSQGKAEDFYNARYRKTHNYTFASEGPAFHDASDLDGFPEGTGVMKRVLCAMQNEATSPGYFVWMKERGEDFRRAPVEFEWHPGYLHNNQAGVYMDKESRSTLEGLYCGGDVNGGGWRQSSGGAFVFGAKAGRNAAVYARKAKSNKVNQEQLLRELKPIVDALSINPSEGYSWIELEDKARMIASEYGPPYTNDAKLERGLTHLKRIETRYLPKLYAQNTREMMRASEVNAIFSNVECHLKAALFRKESRHAETPTIFYKTDYPETDDNNWLKHTVIRNLAGEITLTTKEVKRL
jgi:succinate dehydrogenase/fumarate reductase flavoprotein subunit